MPKNIGHLSYKPVSALLLLAALVGCGPQPETVTPVEEAANELGEQPEPTKAASDEIAIADNNSASSGGTESEAQSTKKVTPKPIFPALAPGEYCYFSETDVETTHARLTIETSDRVIGSVRDDIHDEANGYHTSYRKAVDGTIDGSNLNLDVTTWIEYDKRNEQDTWKVSDSALTTYGKDLAVKSCDTVNKAFQNEAGLEAKDLTRGANRVRTQQVFFEAGKASTIVTNAVVRGDRDVYQLSAQGGQNMTLSITSTEDNAIFDVVSPSGIILGTELTQQTVSLPHTGEYEIIVGGTRGNATYELSIRIR